MSRHRPVFRKLAAILCSGAVVATPALGQERGELLYSTHCGVCHAEQVHWRARRAVTDWSSLRVEVRKWQGVASLAWSEEDVLDVTRYLNDTIYRFPVPLSTAVRTSPPGVGLCAADPGCHLERPSGVQQARPRALSERSAR